MLGTSARIELLSKDNYDTWRIQMEALLIKNKSWGYVNGKNKKPEATADNENDSKLNEWTEMDSMALSDIILAISPPELKTIKNCGTSREVWLKLESIHAAKAPVTKSTLLRRLARFQIIEEGDLRGQLDEFMDIADKLAAMEVPFSQEVLSIFMIQSLPENYENFRCAVENGDKMPSPDELKVKILNESASRKGKASTSSALEQHTERRKQKEKTAEVL